MRDRHNEDMTSSGYSRSIRVVGCCMRRGYLALGQGYVAL